MELKIKRKAITSQIVFITLPKIKPVLNSGTRTSKSIPSSISLQCYFLIIYQCLSNIRMSASKPAHTENIPTVLIRSVKAEYHF